MPGLGDEAHLGLEPGYIGVGPVEFALGRVQQIADRVMIAARLLEIALDFAQPRRFRFEFDRAALDLARMALGFGFGLVAAQQRQQVLLLRAFRGEFVVAACDFGLLLQLLDLYAELLAYIADARQVVAGIGKAVLGLAPALLVLRHAGGLFQEYAQFLGLGLDDARDHPLLDDGVGAWAEARAEEDVVHVAATHVGVVDEIGRFAVPLQHPLD